MLTNQGETVSVIVAGFPGLPGRDWSNFGKQTYTEPPCPCHSRRCSEMSLRAFWEAAWRLLEPHENTYGPSQKRSGHESSFSDLSMVVLGLPTDPSFHE